MVFGLSPVRIPPNDPALGWTGVVHVQHFNGTVARFDRNYGSPPLAKSSFGPAVDETGGLRVRWRTVAASVTAHVRYSMVCDVRCAVDACDHCSADTGSCYSSQDGCGSECDMTLLIDGVAVARRAPAAANRWDGAVELLFPSAPSPGAHDYSLVWPWGAQIEFMGLSVTAPLEPPGAPSTVDAAAAGTAEPPWRALRYVAYGDSITHGFCSTASSYPELLGRLNGE